jgi:hypothetical protein
MKAAGSLDLDTEKGVSRMDVTNTTTAIGQTTKNTERASTPFLEAPTMGLGCETAARERAV